MKDFTKQLGLIVIFLFSVGLIQAFMGNKVAIAFTALILMGMLLVNAEKFHSFLQSFNK